MTTLMTDQRALVRELARQVAELAHEPRMTAIVKRWHDVNALRLPDRAPVYCRPVGCWKELLPREAMECTDPFLRDLEYRFRQVLLKREIDDDDPVMPSYAVQAVIRPLEEPRYGVEIGHRESGTADGAWAYDPPLMCAADFEKLRRPTYIFDREATERQAARLADLFGDLYPVQVQCSAFYGLGTLGGLAANLRGLTQLMLDVALEPELLHRLMAFIRDDVMHYLDVCEQTGLIRPNTGDPMTCSDPIGAPDRDGNYTLKNCWGACNSQEWDQVSPRHWEEFCLEYQRPIMERFGLMQYGCCENLTRKIDGVLSIPNLRVFVLSAWTNAETLVERVQNRHTIMWRQKATDVTLDHDLGRLRARLHEGARRLRGLYYQIVLRELQTLDGHLDRLHLWTQYAREAAEEHAG